jgi:hypothetical protein
MNKTQLRIRTTGGTWPRFVIVRDTPEPDSQREYWGGQTWVREFRAALLYAHKKFAREDLKTVRGKE